MQNDRSNTLLDLARMMIKQAKMLRDAGLAQEARGPGAARHDARQLRLGLAGSANRCVFRSGIGADLARKSVSNLYGHGHEQAGKPKGTEGQSAAKRAGQKRH